VDMVMVVGRVLVLGEVGEAKVEKEDEEGGFMCLVGKRISVVRSSLEGCSGVKWYKCAESVKEVQFLMGKLAVYKLGITRAHIFPLSKNRFGTGTSFARKYSTTFLPNMS
jgi:hypothetical protein